MTNTNIPEEKLKEWREEFEKARGLPSQYFITFIDGVYRASDIEREWRCYLSACKKRQEEYESGIAYRHMHHDITTLRAENEGYKKIEIAYHDSLNELEALKKEIERLRNGV